MKQSHSQLTRRGEIVRNVAAITLAGGLGVAAVSLAESGHLSPLGKDNESLQREAVLKADHATLQTIVLKSGSTYRETPVRIEDANSGDSNEAGVVPEGKNLVTTLSIYDEQNPKWIGFQDPNDAKNIVWANFDDLEDQGLAEIDSKPQYYNTGINASGKELIYGESKPSVPIRPAYNEEQGFMFMANDVVDANGEPVEVASSHLEAVHE